MEKLNVKQLLWKSQQALDGKDSKAMAAFHTGITVAVAIALTVLQFILSEGMGKTSGLSGLGTQAILETMQTVLQWINLIVIPFWGLGFLYVSLQWAKGQYARRGDLLAGFRRIGPYIGIMINRAILTISVVVVTANISSAIYMMTPAASQLTDLAVGASNTEDMYAILGQLSQENLDEILYSMLPLAILWGVLCLALLVPLMYRFRMAEYVILDNPMARGLSSMLISASLLRRRCWQLFKLDLKLWWYYGLKFLCTLLCYVDLLLDTVGIPLPVHEDVAYFLSYGLYLAALFAIEVAFRPRVDTAYACAYIKLVELGPVARKMQMPKPQDMPWDAE